MWLINGECLSCGAPHAVAPDLIGWVTQTKNHCLWKKQPETPAELEMAIAVLEIQDRGCHRYAGTNSMLLARVSPELCDHGMQPASRSHSAVEVPFRPLFTFGGSDLNILSKIWGSFTEWHSKRGL